jgi:signal transduction histidine kinase/ActR/RegA family two-component response regulator
MRQLESKKINLILKIWIVLSLCLPSLALALVLDTLDENSAQSTEIIQSTHLFQGGKDLVPPPLRDSIDPWLSTLDKANNLSLTGGTYWYKLTIEHQQESAAWVLDVANSLVEYIDIYLYDETLIKHMPSGYYQTGEFAFHYARSLTLEPDKPYTLLVRLNSRYFPSQTQIKLHSRDAYQKIVLRDNLMTIVSLGTLLALALYNIFIYAGTRDRNCLYYSIYLFCYFAGWAMVIHLPNELFGWNLLELNYIPFFLLPLVSAHFCINFLALKKFEPTLTKVLKINGYVSLALIPSGFFLIPYFHTLATIIVGIWVTTAIIAGVKRWQQGYRPAGYLIFAFLCFLIPASFILPSNIGLPPDFYSNADLVILFAGTLHAILLAFAMADRLNLRNQKNRQLTTELVKKVESRTKELKQANFHLEQSNNELVQARNAKSRFLANMSHEIRTPLASIIGYADGILLGDIDKSEQARVIKMIGENGSHLMNVVNDILDISKIEANQLDFKSIPTPLFSVLAQIESIVGKRARDKGLAFHLEYQYPLPAQIYTDPTRLKQILFNLTNNALKFTEQGYIGLSVKAYQQKLLIIVKDSGQGISTEQQTRLFDPFSQADSSINRRFGGTGLGLSISQRLARGLGGKIEVNSAPRKGSTFSLSIDLKMVEDSPSINSVSEIWQSTPAESVTPETLPSFAGSKVLLADDHPSNRELIALTIKRMNVEVIEVANGKQVLDSIFYQSFDLLLIDIHMPEMGGIEALGKIRAAGNNTPAVALTANNMKHEIDHYMRIGFSDHLAKPISRKHFIATLTKYLRKEGQEDGPFK